MSNYSQLKQEDLVELAKQGDQFAYEQLYQTCGPQLYAYLQRLFGNEQDAQDVLQEAFLTCWQKLRSLRKNRSFGTWLYSIASNAAYKRLFQTKPQLWLSLEEHEQVMPTNDTHEMTFEESIIRKMVMERALLHVSPRNRRCMLLQIVADLPQREIAELLEIDVKHVSTYVKRGLVQLYEAYNLLEETQNISERKEANL